METTGQSFESSERETIVATQKNGDGDLTAFKTSSGRVLDYSSFRRGSRRPNRRSECL